MPRTLRYPQAVPTKLQTGDVYIKGNKAKVVGEDGLWYDYDPQIDPPIQSPLAGGITGEDLRSDSQLSTAAAVAPQSRAESMIEQQGYQLEEAQRSGTFQPGVDRLYRELGISPPPAPPKSVDPAYEPGPEIVLKQTAARVLPPLAAGAVLGPLGVGALGIAAGAATAAGGGELLAQNIGKTAGQPQYAEGYNLPQVAGQSVLGAIPGSSLKALKALPGIKGVMARMVAQAGLGGVIGAPAAVATGALDARHANRPFTVEEATDLALLGGGAGMALGGLTQAGFQEAPRAWRAAKTLAGQQATGASSPTVSSAADDIARMLGLKAETLPTPPPSPTRPIAVYGEDTVLNPRLRAPQPRRTGVTVPPELVPTTIDPTVTPTPSSTPIDQPPVNPLAEFAPVAPEDPTAALRPAGGVPGSPRVEAPPTPLTWRSPEILQMAHELRRQGLSASEVTARIKTRLSTQPPPPAPGSEAGYVSPQAMLGLGGGLGGAIAAPVLLPEEFKEDPLMVTALGAGAGFALGAGGVAAFRRALSQTDEAATALRSTVHQKYPAASASLWTKVRAPGRDSFPKLLKEAAVQVVETPSRLLSPYAGLKKDLPRFMPAVKVLEMSRTREGGVPARAKAVSEYVFLDKRAQPSGPLELQYPGSITPATYEVMGDILAVRRRIADVEKQLAEGVTWDKVLVERTGDQIQQGVSPQHVHSENQGLLRDMLSSMPPDVWAKVKPALTRWKQVMDTLKAYHVSVGRLSQAAADSPFNEYYMPEYVLKQDQPNPFFGGQRPMRDPSKGRMIARKGHEERTISDPLTVLTRHVEDFLKMQERGRAVQALAKQYDPRVTNPQATMPDDYTPFNWDGVEHWLPAQLTEELTRHVSGSAPLELLARRATSVYRQWLLNPINVGTRFDMGNLLGDNITAMWEADGYRDIPALMGKYFEVLEGKLHPESPAGKLVAAVEPTTGVQSAVADTMDIVPRDTKLLWATVGWSTNPNSLVRVRQNAGRGMQQAAIGAQELLAEVRGFREALGRDAVALHALQKAAQGIAPDEAGRLANAKLVNYSGLSDFANRVIRGYMMPFWTWSSSILANRTPGLRRDPATGSRWLGAMQATEKLAKYTLPLSLGLPIFNELVFKEYENNHLTPEERKIPHTFWITGKDDKGLIISPVFFGNAAQLGADFVKNLQRFQKDPHDPRLNVHVLGAPFLPGYAVAQGVGMEGFGRRLLDWAEGRQDLGEAFNPEDMAKSAGHFWASMVGLPAAFWTMATGRPLRKGLESIDEDYPWLSPGSMNPVGSNTKGGRRLREAVTSLPPYSSWYSSLRKEGVISEAWSEFLARKVFAGYAREIDLSPDHQKAMNRLMASSKGRAGQDRHDRYWENFLSEASKTLMMTAEGPREMPSFEGVVKNGPDRALADYTMYLLGGNPTGARAVKDAVERAVQDGLPSPQIEGPTKEEPVTWQSELDQIRALANAYSSAYDEMAIFNRERERQEKINALPFWKRNRWSSPSTADPTMLDFQRQLNQQQQATEDVTTTTPPTR